jgi:hypothetical protein
LVCDLNANNKYTLRFGNNKLKLPEAMWFSKFGIWVLAVSKNWAA